MIRRLNKFGHLLVLVSIIALIVCLSVVCSSCWGTPTFELIVENQTEYDLTIYINDYNIGEVNSGDQIIRPDIPWDINKYAIKAINTLSETIFSETLTRQNMQEIKSRVYKVVIPASFENFPSPKYELTSENLPWIEFDGEFRTKDLGRAQEEIPFTIVIPEYIPGNKSNVLPEIRGPLKEYQPDSNRIRIEIIYCIDLGEKEPGFIYIIERNYPVIFGNPESNRHLEYIEIKGIRMVKTVKRFDPIYYHFNCNDICFTVQFINYNLPLEEAIKVIESMIE